MSPKTKKPPSVRSCQRRAIGNVAVSNSSLLNNFSDIELTLVVDIFQSVQARDCRAYQVLPCRRLIFSFSFGDQSDHHERARADKPLAVLRIISVVVLELDDGRRIDGLAILGVVLLHDLRPRRVLSNNELNPVAGHHNSGTTLTGDGKCCRCCCSCSLGLEGTRAVVLPWESLRFCEDSKVRTGADSLCQR